MTTMKKSDRETLARVRAHHVVRHICSDGVCFNREDIEDDLDGVLAEYGIVLEEVPEAVRHDIARELAALADRESSAEHERCTLGLEQPMDWA